MLLAFLLRAKIQSRCVSSSLCLSCSSFDGTLPLESPENLESTLPGAAVVAGDSRRRIDAYYPALSMLPVHPVQLESIQHVLCRRLALLLLSAAAACSQTITAWQPQCATKQLDCTTARSASSSWSTAYKSPMASSLYSHSLAK